MSNHEINTLISDLVVNFFKSINAEINESMGLYQIKIPKSHELLFNKENLKFAFDPDVARENLCELVVPGSNTLLIIMNLCLKNGAVIISKYAQLDSTPNSNSLGIRFHFYVLFDGINNSSLIKTIDVNYQTSEISQQKIDLIPLDTNFTIKLDEDLVDYAYIAAIDHLNKIMQVYESKFLDETFTLKNTEFDNVNKEYQKKLDEIDDEIQNLRVKNNVEKTRIENSVFSAANMIEIIRSEQNNVLQTIAKKYRTRIDYALFAAEVFSI